MPLPLSSVVIEQKNKLGSGEPILILLELIVPSMVDPIYLVRNNEDITWDGKVWQAFPFDLDEITEEATGEVQQVAIRIANASRAIERYLIEYDQWLKTNIHENIIAKLYIVAYADLTNTTPIRMFEFKVSSFYTNATEAVFMLTQDNVYLLRFPPNKLIRRCRFKFGSLECGYTPIAGQVCNKTLTACRSYNNSERFGGYPSVGGGFERVISE